MEVLFVEGAKVFGLLAVLCAGYGLIYGALFGAVEDLRQSA